MWRLTGQAIAPLHIVQRIANKSALTSNTFTSGRISGFRAQSRGESTSVSGAFSGGDHASSVDERGMNSDEVEVRARITSIEFHQAEI